MHVPFIVEGLDDHGEPSGSFLEATLVALLDADGHELGRFTPADVELFRARFWSAATVWRLKALETTGLPQADLTGDYLCEA